MKRIFFIIISLFLFNSAYAGNTGPVVTNVTVHQRSGTNLVDITYDVFDADGDPLTLTVQVSGDSGQTFTITPVTLSGDVGSGIQQETGKAIAWDTGSDYPGNYVKASQVKVIANDDKGRVVNDGYGDYLLVPAGEFKMGDNFNEGDSSEKPVHTVYLDAYYIGKYEVTNEQYCQFLNEKGNQTEGGGSTWLEISSSYCLIEYSEGEYKPKSGKADHPVVEVNWYGARAYCNWLSEKTGKTYRLPTEAEWEKAARGTDQKRYPWGNSIDGSYANYYNSGVPNDNGSTPVGYYDGTKHGIFSTKDNKSPYGAYDMAGNVWEWCSDWYRNNYYASSPLSNPSGPSSGTYRVIRGGSWSDSMYHLRSAYRGSTASIFPGARDYHLGFRCVRE